MPIILIIYFDKLHRYVYKYYFQSKSKDWGLPSRYDKFNKGNKLRNYNKIIYKIYLLLLPLFKNFRVILYEKYPNKKEYQRYKRT